MPLAVLPAELGGGGARVFEVRAYAGTSGDGGHGTKLAVGDSGWSDTVPSEP
jgi:hypothetical protein